MLGMDGLSLLSTPVIPLILLVVALYFLYLTIRNRDVNRTVTKIFKIDLFDTSKPYSYFTVFIGLSAISAHLLAEYYFHIYDITPIDVFTHGLSGMAVTAAILNFNLTRNRKIYYMVGIGASWMAFLGWEVFEGVYFYFNPLGMIQTNLWDTMIDLWVDTLGALSVCFICDELTED